MANNSNDINTEVNIKVVAENLVELLTNSVNLTDVYYDLFFNPTPLDIELQMYNEDNELITVTIPNRAKDRRIAIIGEGSPEGEQEAVAGTIYVDSSNGGFIYIKVTETGKTGWRSVVIFPSLEGKADTFLHTNGSTIEWKKAGNVSYNVVGTLNDALEVQLYDAVTEDNIVPRTNGANRDLTNLTQLGINYLKDSNALKVTGDLHSIYSIYDNIRVRKTNTTHTDTYTIEGQTISITYNLSTLGEKIVSSSDTASVNAVKDLYNATGSALYYILDEANNRYSLPVGTIYGFLSTLNNKIVEEVNNFVGMIAYFPKDTQKKGWLRCNGGTFNASDYPLLYAYLGSTTLPSLDGKFIRCVGTGRTALSEEDAEIGAHYHPYSFNISSSGTHSHNISNSGEHEHSYSGSITSSGAHSHTASFSFSPQVKSASFMGLTNGAGGVTAVGVPDLIPGTFLSISGSIDTGGAHTHNYSGTISNSGSHTHSINNSGSHTHTYSGTTSNNSGSENRPANIALVAMIRCDI